MPRIIVEWLEGRSKEQRDQIAKEVTETFVNIVKVRPEQVTVLFKENNPNFQYKGGKNYEAIK